MKSILIIDSETTQYTFSLLPLCSFPCDYFTCPTCTSPSCQTSLAGQCYNPLLLPVCKARRGPGAHSQWV